MDPQDQVLQKLTAIDRQLKSLRYTFGVVIIILAALLTVAAPAVVHLVSSSMPVPVATMAAPVQSATMPQGAQAYAAAPATTTAATTTAATTTKP